MGLLFKRYVNSDEFFRHLFCSHPSTRNQHVKVSERLCFQKKRLAVSSFPLRNLRTCAQARCVVNAVYNLKGMPCTVTSERKILATNFGAQVRLKRRKKATKRVQFPRATLTTDVGNNPWSRNWQCMKVRCYNPTRVLQSCWAPRCSGALALHVP
eukprot:s369_g33.t1